MTISGNRSSMTIDARRAGLPQTPVHIQNVKLNGDGKVWPCGLMLHKGASGWDPYDTTDTGRVAVLDEETDTAQADSALAVKFGAVKKDELKVGVDAPAAPVEADLDKLEDRHIYPF